MRYVIILICCQQSRKQARYYNVYLFENDRKQCYEFSGTQFNYKDQIISPESGTEIQQVSYVECFHTYVEFLYAFTWIMAGQTNHARTTFSMMNGFYVRGEHCDVQLQVDRRLFKCHRVLLAATSIYFDTLFKRRDFKELYPTPDTPIILHKLEDATAFEEILHIMYTGEIFVNDSNALHLLSLSKFLKLRTDDVKKECLQHLTSRFLETILTADAIDSFCSAVSKRESTIAHTSAHIFGHLYYFLMDARLTEISLENLKSLVLCGKRIIAPLPGSSDVLLAIIYNWVNRNREERSRYRRELMDIVDSSMVSSDFRVSYTERLESAVDEAILSKDFQSISGMRMDAGDIGGNARLCATISFNVKNIRELEDGQEKCSAAYIVSNLSFKTCVERELDCLKVSARCDGTDLTPVWSCFAGAIFTIKSLKKEVGDLVGDSDCDDLYSDCPGYYVSCRCSWKFHDLINPQNGFIRDDDSITVVALVYAGVPTCIYKYDLES